MDLNNSTANLSQEQRRYLTAQHLVILLTLFENGSTNISSLINHFWVHWGTSKRIQSYDFQQILLLIRSIKQIRKSTLRDIWNFSTANNLDKDTVKFYHILMELNKLPSTTDQRTSEGVKTISSIYDVPKVSKKTRIAPTIYSVV